MSRTTDDALSEDRAGSADGGAPEIGDRSDPYGARPVDRVLDPEGYGRSGEPGERAEIGKPYLRPARLAILFGLFAALGIWRGLPILLIVLGVLVMIFFHELGHFVMARRAGMKVTEFMIGFGPRIFSFRRGDVEYGIKAIPAGAYVKIIGMANVEEVPPEDESQTYRQKGYWARMGVAVAGSTAHFIMALLLIIASFVFVGRVSEERWGVATIAPDSAAALAGVEEGDRVVSIDGVAVADHDEMAAQAQRHPDETVPVVVERDGREVELTASITARFFVYGTTEREFQIYGNGDGGYSLSISDASPLLDEGLEDGDRLTSVNGTPVSDADSIRSVLTSSAVATTGAMELGVVHPGDESPTDVAIDLGSEAAISKSQGFFGVGKELIPEKLGVVEAVPASLAWFGETTKLSITGMAKFFNPASLADFAKRTFTTVPGEEPEATGAQLSSDASSQYVERNSNRIVSIVGAVVLGEGLTDGDAGRLLAFFALLNMAIGLLNLIPLPPFDGGHVAIGTYERIRELLRRDGRRYFADYNKIMPVALAVVSFMVVIGLMAMYLDLADPIRL